MNGLLASTTFQSQMGITLENKADRIGSIAAALQVGGLLGAIIQSFINDGIGRKSSILVMCVVFSIGVVIQTLSHSLEVMLVGRFISGIAVSVMSVAVSMYNTEMAPSKIRGTIVGAQQLMVAVGSAFAYWLNYLMRNVEGQAQVVVPLGLQLVPAVFLFAGLIFLPRSPRWLASQGLLVEARESLAKIRQLPLSSDAVNDEMEEITTFLDQHKSSFWSEVFSPDNLQRLQIGVPFILFQQFLGQNLINYYSPTLFKSLGLDSNGADLFATGFIGIIKILMTVPALILVDKLGRRPLMLTGTILMAGSFYFIGYYTTLNSTSIGVAGYVVIYILNSRQ